MLHTAILTNVRLSGKSEWVVSDRRRSLISIIRNNVVPFVRG
jgi:hypothetical protein